MAYDEESFKQGFALGRILHKPHIDKNKTEYLTFSSKNEFTLRVIDNLQHWKGRIEYSTDKITWTTWGADNNLWGRTETLSSHNGKLYLRGTGNTSITYPLTYPDYGWILDGTNIKCEGNIETVLDYLVVANGEHPAIGEGCFKGLFKSQDNLISAPNLPSTILAESCYDNMFYGCTSLTKAPELPSTSIGPYCYYSMFQGCTSLTQAPTSLPATTLAESCYANMFYGCTSLTKAPELPATELADECYSFMFFNCNEIKVSPMLPATIMAEYCYDNMFNSCHSLRKAPELPATMLAEGCYQYMFLNCSKLETAPVILPANTLANGCYTGMFRDCTSLVKAPKLPATILARNCYASMFYGCISLKYIPTLPATNLVDGCYKTMFCDCSSLELSWKYSSERPYLYKIPTVGEGIGFPGATEAMVARIGFLEEPISHYDLNLGLFINTPYYINYPPV